MVAAQQKTFETRVHTQGTLNNLSAENISSATAINGLVENSFDSGADAISLWFNHSPHNKDGAEFVIADSGKGMNEQELHNALEVNRPNKPPSKDGFYASKGRYGKGLKLAIASLTDQFMHVYTKTEGGQWLKASISLAEDSNTYTVERQADGDFSRADRQFVKKYQVGVKGTIIHVPDANKMTNSSYNNLYRWPRHLNKDEDGLGVTFYHHIKEQGTRVQVNGQKITLYDPLELNNKATTLLGEFVFLIEGVPVKCTCVNLDKNYPKERLRPINSSNVGGSLIRDGQEIGRHITKLFDYQGTDNFKYVVNTFRFAIEIPPHKVTDALFNVNSQKGEWKENNLSDVVRDTLSPFIRKCFDKAFEQNVKVKEDAFSKTLKDIFKDIEKELRINSKGMLVPVGPREKRNIQQVHTPDGEVSVQIDVNTKTKGEVLREEQERDIRTPSNLATDQESKIRNYRINHVKQGEDGALFQYYRSKEKPSELSIVINSEHSLIARYPSPKQSPSLKNETVRIVALAVSMCYALDGVDENNEVTNRIIDSYSVNAGALIKKQ